jgi:hypothetical protein
VSAEAVRHGLCQLNAAADGDDVNILRRALQEDVAHEAADDVTFSAQTVRFFLYDAKNWQLKVTYQGFFGRIWTHFCLFISELIVLLLQSQRNRFIFASCFSWYKI